MMCVMQSNGPRIDPFIVLQYGRAFQASRDDFIFTSCFPSVRYHLNNFAPVCSTHKRNVTL